MSLKKTTTTHSKLRANIWKFYVHEMCAGMFFAIPVIVLFWQENGLSLTEIMILQSLFSMAVVSLEIPTGYFADRYGRKKALMIAATCSIFAVTAYSLGHNFTHFLIAEMFFALDIAFGSGASSAFMYDTLIELKKEKQYKQIWGNAIFMGIMAMGVSNILGGLIAKIDLRTTLVASIPFFILALGMASSFHEPKRHKRIVKKGYGHALLKTTKIAILKNTKLKWLMIYSGVIFAFNQAGLWLYQPYFKLSGLDIVHFGLIFGSFQIIAALSSKYSHKLEKKLGQKHSLIMLLILVSGSYFLMSNFIFLFSFSFAFLHQFVRGFQNVVVSDYINQLTASEIRATVLSIQSFIGRIIYAAIIPFVGWIADVYSLIEALEVLGITTLGIGTISLMMLKKSKIL